MFPWRPSYFSNLLHHTLFIYKDGQTDGYTYTRTHGHTHLQDSRCVIPDLRILFLPPRSPERHLLGLEMSIWGHRNYLGSVWAGGDNTSPNELEETGS